MSVGLVLLAFRTAFNVAADKESEAGPPEFGSNKLMGFEEARMSSKLVIMTAFKDGTVEGVISRDVDTAFVSEDSSFNLPISKAREEREGNILMHRLKCL